MLLGSSHLYPWLILEENRRYNDDDDEPRNKLVLASLCFLLYYDYGFANHNCIWNEIWILNLVNLVQNSDIYPHWLDQVRQRVLSSAYLRAMKDPFPPAARPEFSRWLPRTTSSLFKRVLNDFFLPSALSPQTQIKESEIRFVVTDSIYLFIHLLNSLASNKANFL